MYKTTLDFDKLNIHEGHIAIRPLIQNLCLIAKYACSLTGGPPTEPADRSLSDW